MPRLLLEDDSGNVREVELNGEVTIGRAKDNTICLPERNISRHHVRITVEGDRVFVEDAGSSFGVYIEDMPVTGKVQLLHGKTLEFGDYRARLVGERVAEEAKKPSEEAPEREVVEETRLLRPVTSGEEEETEISRPKAWNVVFLVVLLAIAGALGFFYFSLSKEPVEASGGKGISYRQSVPHVLEQESKVEEPAKPSGLSEEGVEGKEEIEKPIPAQEKKERVGEKPLKEVKPKEQKPEQKKELAAVQTLKNLPQPKTQKTASPVEMRKPPQQMPQAEDCVALVRKARDEGRYDRAVQLLNGSVCKGNPQVAQLWDSLGNRIRNTDLQKACEYWKRARVLTNDRTAAERLEIKINTICK